MADSGKPTVGDVIHKTDLDGCLTAVALNISGRIDDEVSYVLNNTTLSGNSSEVVFKSTQDLTSGTDTALVEKKAVVNGLDNILKNNKVLLATQLTSGTKTIDNMLNYKLIGIYIFNGTSQYLSGATCATPWHLINYCNDSGHRLVLSTDVFYYAIYFPSATSVAVHNYHVGSGTVPTVNIVGIW